MRSPDELVIAALADLPINHYRVKQGQVQFRSIVAALSRESWQIEPHDRGSKPILRLEPKLMLSTWKRR